MKALAGSCSRAIVDTLGSFSPRATLRVSVTPEFFFSLRSRNHKNGSNLWILKLVQNKGLYPLHAVPPNHLVDLEPAEPQGQQSEQTNETKFVRVAFQLQKDCDFGEQFLIVGDDPMLGSWDPLDALPMTWSEGHVWTVEQDMPAGKSIQFKFILKEKGGNIIWQPGSDRIIHTSKTMNKITVSEDWENAELQKIIEEDQLALVNEEPQVDPEVSSFAEILDNPQEGLDSNVYEIPGIEDTQNHAEEKPLAEPVMQQITGNSSSSSIEKPMAIVAENISSSENLIKSTSEESADGPGIGDIINDIEHNGSAASFMNQEMTIVEGSLFDFEEGPVLVPGLVIPPTVQTDEAGQGEVQEMTTTDTSVGAFETQDQNIPENEWFGAWGLKPCLRISHNSQFIKILVPAESFQFSKEQETEDATPQEINATINEDQSHLPPEKEDRLNYQPVEDDIKWGQETEYYQKILSF
ncbi:Alpha-amylase, partial [Mucuna pruriens]